MNSQDSYLIKFLDLVVWNCQQQHFLPYINHSLQDPGGLLGLIFAWYVPLASHNPYPVIVYSVDKYIDPILVTFGKLWFPRSQLSNFLFMHLSYKAH